MIPDDAGAPVVLELELVEPSLFLAYAEGSADRVADAIAARLSAAEVPPPERDLVADRGAARAARRPRR